MYLNRGCLIICSLQHHNGLTFVCPRFALWAGKRERGILFSRHLTIETISVFLHGSTPLRTLLVQCGGCGAACVPGPW